MSNVRGGPKADTTHSAGDAGNVVIYWRGARIYVEHRFGRSRKMLGSFYKLDNANCFAMDAAKNINLGLAAPNPLVYER